MLKLDTDYTFPHLARRRCPPLEYSIMRTIFVVFITFLQKFLSNTSIVFANSKISFFLIGGLMSSEP